MAIADTLQEMAQAVEDAKDAIEAAGGSVGDTGLAGLATEIESIPSGGGDEPVADPEIIYQRTRPADWLKMPTEAMLGDREFYFLLLVDGDRTDDFNFKCDLYRNDGETVAVNTKLEFGTTDSTGAFTPDSSLTVTGDVQTTVPMSAFGNTTSTGEKQLIAKVTLVSDPTTGYRFAFSDRMSTDIVVNTVDFVGKFTNRCGSVKFGSTTSGTAELRFVKLRYVAIYGDVNLDSAHDGYFAQCSSLICLRSWPSQRGINNTSAFSGCNKLEALPLNLTVTPTAITGCPSIRALGNITIWQTTQTISSSTRLFPMYVEKIGNVTFSTYSGKASSLKGAFSNMPRLVSIEGITINSDHFASSIDFSYLFSSCLMLKRVPQFDTSAGTNFSNMFSSCWALESIPLIDTSAGTNFSYMFNQCYLLRTIPLLDTSHGTNFNNMFNLCYSLKNIPAISTTAATEATQMFGYCTSLEEITLSLPGVASMSQTFYGCSLLKSASVTVSSTCTTFSNTFTGCNSLKDVSLSGTTAVTKFEGIFSHCSSLESASLEGATAGFSINSAFSNCHSLTSASITGKVTTTNSAFSNCRSLVTGPQIDTSICTDMAYMFNRCYSLTSIPQYDTSSCLYFGSMFAYCTGLVSVPNMDVSTITSASGCSRMYDSTAATTYDLSGYGFVDGAYTYFIINYAGSGATIIMDSPDSLGNTNKFVSFKTGVIANIDVKITKDDAIISITNQATSIFDQGSNGSVINVYVPDTLYATYQADTNWATLGDRLKKLSDFPT